ncbi:MAG: DNA-processing protein DprA [Clostridiaceae bacterium]
MEDKKLIYYLWLTKIKGIGPVTSRKLIDYFGESENIYNSGIEELIRVNGIGTETANSIYSNKDLMEAEKILDSCREKNIGISVYNDEIFPRELNKYEDNPIIIYYSGKLYKELKGVGIIGARRCNEYGKKVAVEAASYLGSLGIPVISGLAKGIDSYAHTACIKASGFTAAVLGCGIDICYPEEHRNLMEKIKETGLLISEYPPGTSVKKENFPKRNRLISSLSEKILIAEAGEKSGALITANYSKLKGKKIYSAPNSIYMKEFKGSNKLIEEGANIYLNKEQLFIECMSIKKETPILKNDKEEFKYSDLERKIIIEIEKRRLSIDELSTVIHADKNELMNSILNLELQGMLLNMAGVYKIAYK